MYVVGRFTDFSSAQIWLNRRHEEGYVIRHISSDMNGLWIVMVRE